MTSFLFLNRDRENYHGKAAVSVYGNITDICKRAKHYRIVYSFINSWWYTQHLKLVWWLVFMMRQRHWTCKVTVTELMFQHSLLLACVQNLSTKSFCWRQFFVIFEVVHRELFLLQSSFTKEYKAITATIQTSEYKLIWFSNYFSPTTVDQGCFNSVRQ